MKTIEFYNNLRVTLGWSGFPQITESDGKIFYSKKVDFIFYPECYPLKELNEYPINPHTKEKLIIEEFEEINTQQYKKGNSTLILWAILAFILIFLCGCGSRKVQKSEIKITETAKVETTKVDSSKTVTVTDTNTKIVDSSSTDEFTIIPIDSTKEMIVSGKSYFNAKLSHKTTKANIVSTKQETVNTTRQNDIKEGSKSQTVKHVEVVTKDSERESFFKWWYWLILILIASGLFFTYRFYKKLWPF